MNLGTHDQVQKFLRVREQSEVGKIEKLESPKLEKTRSWKVLSRRVHHNTKVASDSTHEIAMKDTLIFSFLNEIVHVSISSYGIIIETVELDIICFYANFMHLENQLDTYNLKSRQK